MILRNLSRVDLNLLHVFLVIYEQQSITRAAGMLNLSQPAVSNSVAKLRGIFGDPLFVRAGSGIAPTPLAHRLIEPVREALSKLQHAFSEYEAFDPVRSQRILCLSMSDFAEAILLPLFVGELGRTGSRLEVQNHFIPQHEIQSRLASGELDFAIESDPLDGMNLERLLLLEDEFVCVVREGHPAEGGDITLDAYLALDHLHISNRPRHSNIVDSALAQIRRQRRVTVSIEHCLAAGAILAASDLCLTIPRVFVERYLPHPDFVVLARPFAMRPLRTWLYWHPATADSPAHVWARETIGRLAIGLGQVRPFDKPE